MGYRTSTPLAGGGFRCTELDVSLRDARLDRRSFGDRYEIGWRAHLPASPIAEVQTTSMRPRVAAYEIVREYGRSMRDR